MIDLVAALAIAASQPPTPAKPLAERGSLASLISTDDYPAAALRNEEQGTVAIRLDIGVDGAVTACTVTGSSGSQSLDSTTCRLLQQRARFSPARDARGRPVPDTYTQHIAWRIVGPVTAPPEYQAAATVWFSCLGSAVAARLAGKDAAEAIVAKAFDLCIAEERALVAVGARVLPDRPAVVGSDALRAGIRAELLKQIAAVRAGAGS